MNATASPQQEFYDAYKNSGIIIGELVPSSIIALISVAGWFFNFNLIYATLRHKSLHGTCNVLLAISAFCDTLIELSNLVWFGVTVTGTNFLPLGTCVKLNTLPLIGVSGSVVLMFLVSFDRLISVLLPQIHRNLRKPIYLSVLCCSVVPYAAFVLYLTYSNASVQTDSYVPCCIVDAMSGNTGEVFFQICILFNICTVACYVVIWAALRTRRHKNDTTRKLFKCLAVITAIVIAGWISNALAQVMLRAIQASPITIQFYAFYGGIPPNLAAMSHLPVLYTFRQALKS